MVIRFENMVNGRHITLNDSNYLNPFGETYTISKFRYYITNIKLESVRRTGKESNSYHLIDEAKPGSRNFSCTIKEGEYSSMSFLLGVDSIHNVSGAQTGALDPLNDMFWTWNTGYVMAKLEGISSSSLLRNNIFEYHIGGFKGNNCVLQNIDLRFPSDEKVMVRKGHITEIIIQANINEWWTGSTDLKISTNASITTPGIFARKISANYAKMFVVQKVFN